MIVNDNGGRSTGPVGTVINTAGGVQFDNGQAPGTVGTVGEGNTQAGTTADATGACLVHPCSTDLIKPIYVWRTGRNPLIDDSSQGPLAEDQVVRSGQGIAPGKYIFVQKLDGSVVAMNEDLYDTGAFDPEADWPGHTSLADHEPVFFAGQFTVDAEGNVLEITNGSGHYQPGSYAPAFNESDYMALRDVAAQALDSFGLNVTESTLWNPWPVRN